jgi:hypothetical protein
MKKPGAVLSPAEVGMMARRQFAWPAAKPLTVTFPASGKSQSWGEGHPSGLFLKNRPFSCQSGRTVLSSRYQLRPEAGGKAPRKKFGADSI